LDSAGLRKLGGNIALDLGGGIELADFLTSVNKPDGRRKKGGNRIRARYGVKVAVR
jgi:hypothetical protein